MNHAHILVCIAFVLTILVIVTGVCEGAKCFGHLTIEDKLAIVIAVVVIIAAWEWLP